MRFAIYHIVAWLKFLFENSSSILITFLTNSSLSLFLSTRCALHNDVIGKLVLNFSWRCGRCSFQFPCVWFFSRERRCSGSRKNAVDAANSIIILSVPPTRGMPSLRLNYYLNKPAIFLECPIPIESFYIYIRAYLCRVIGQTVDELLSLTLPLAFSYFNLYFFIKSFLFPSSTSSLPFRFSLIPIILLDLFETRRFLSSSRYSQSSIVLVFHPDLAIFIVKKEGKRRIGEDGKMKNLSSGD